MAKNKRKRKMGFTPPQSSPQDIVHNIVRIAAEITSTDQPGPLWGELHKAFLKSTVDSTIAAKIIMHKDMEELQQVVLQLQSGTKVHIQEEEIIELPTLSHETQIEAMRVFRKREKFMKLDRESTLGVGPLTGGKEAKFDSMAAPHDYPIEVWKALAADGQLVDDGGGFFHVP